MAKSGSKQKLILPTQADYAALGKFIAECSIISVMLVLILRELTGIDEKLARVIISTGDTRFGDLITMIKGVVPLKVADQKASPTFSRLLSWATYMNDVRSYVAHKPFYRRGGKLYFHNTITAKTEDAKFTYETSAKELNALTDIGMDLAVALSLLPDYQAKFISDCLVPKENPDAALLGKLKLPARPKDKLQGNGQASSRQQKSARA